MRVGEAEGDPEGDGRRTLANGWESRLWRLEDKHLREGSSVRQFGRPRPLRIRHRRRRRSVVKDLLLYLTMNVIIILYTLTSDPLEQKGPDRETDAHSASHVARQPLHPRPTQR